MIAVTPIRRLFVVFALFLSGTCLANAQSLYQTDFEVHEGFVNEAPLSGSWSATGSSVVIADDEPYLGAQSVFIPSANIENVVSLRFDPSGNTILFVDYYMQLTASLLPSLPALTTPETTALVAVHNYEFGVGEWSFLDGDGLGSGTWFHAGYRVPVDESYRTGWHRITLRLNLILNTWDAYIDGTLLATDLGFVEPFSAGSEAINIYGSSTGPSYLDNFSLSAVNPLFTDEDSDGLDDSFESLYGLDSSIDDRNLDPDSDGFTNVEEYKYSTDPTTSNTIVVELPENGNLTVINEANGNLQIVNDGQLLLDVPLDGAYNLQIIGKGNSGDIDVLLDGTLIGMLNVEGDVGTVRFNSALSILADLNISGANTVLFNGAVSVEGSTSIKVSEDLILDLNSSLAVISGDLNGTVGGDFIVRGNSDISVSAGNAFFNVVGAIWLDDGSSLIVDNAAAAFGTMQLNSGKTITMSDNSSITTNNNYMLLIAQDYISLTDNSTVTAAGGYVIIQTRRDFTVTDSEMSLNSVTLFVQVERSLHVVRSAIHVETGIAQLSVFVNATVDENSSLTVNKGDLYAQVNGNLTVSDNSEVSVTEGSIGLNVIGNTLVERNSRLKVTNSVVSGKSLQLIVSGTTTFDSDSVLAVDKTELNLFSFDNINLISSTLTVSTGNAFIRTNANLSLTDSTLSITRGNLSVNVARSMNITGSDITATTGSFYLNTGVDTIMDADSTLTITGGDLYANIFGRAVLGGAVYMQNLFAMYVQGNFTLSETGTLDAFIIYLSSGQNIAIDGRMDTHFGNGQVYLNTQDSIYMKSMDPITAEVLSVASVTGIFLRTEVEQLTAQAVGIGLDRALNLGNYTGSAEIEIHEVDDIILNTMYNVDGPIRVVAGGTIQALQVLLTTDAPGHNVGLMSTGGDIEVGVVSIGTTQGQISLSASGEIRESSEFDADADLIGNMAVMYAGTSIASGDAALEMSVNESHEFANTDVIFDTAGDVELYLSTGSNRVDVRSLQGDIVITRLLSEQNYIKVESTEGKIYIGDLDNGNAGDNSVFVTMSENSVPDNFELVLSAAELAGNSLSWSISSNGNRGVASIEEPVVGDAAVINYVPGSNFSNVDSFVVRVSDENGNTKSVAITVMVGSVNTPPVVTLPINEVTIYRDTDDFTYTLNLYDAFEDLETSDENLSFAVEISDPELLGYVIYGQDLVLSSSINENAVTRIKLIATDDDVSNPLSTEKTIDVTLKHTRDQDNDFVDSKHEEFFGFNDDNDQDVITNTSSNIINGTTGNDQLYGGIGDDLVYGGNGNDLYYWYWGDGRDYYLDYSGANNLVFGAGIDLSHLSFERVDVSSSTYLTDGSAVASGQDLKITITHPTDASLSGSIVIENWLGYRGYWNLYFENIFYTNGNTLATDMDDVVTGGYSDDILHGLGGNDRLTGADGDDQLIGGIGNDSVDGGHGFDRFVWKFGDGEDFYQANYRAGYYKTLVLGPGITSAMIAVENGNVSSSNYLTAWLNDSSGSDRKFIITHPTDSSLDGSVIIDNWKTYSGYWRVEFEDGEVWDAIAYPDSVNATGTVSDDTLNGANGADNLQGGAGDDLIDAAYGADWISGDEGEDYIETGEGDDTVFWDLGDGHDFVLGAYFTDENKTLKLGSEITSDMLSFEKGDISSSAFKTSKMSAWIPSVTGADLRVVITHPTDSSLSGSIIIDNWNSYSNYWLIKLTEEMISYYGNSLTTSGNDSISGTSNNDSFSGDEGNDTLDGNDGDDNLDGGVGNDMLSGGGGDDILDGGTGNDTLNGDYGDDQLIGGVGNDKVYGYTGNDTYHWNYGDGEDYYYDSYGSNRLVLGPEIDASRLSFERGNVNSTTYQTGWSAVASGQDLKITITHPTDPALSGSIVIENWSSYQNYWNLYFEDVFHENGNRIATPQNDALTGTSETDTFSGLTGDDTLTGYQGDDVLHGNEGSDTLNGNEGNDALDGGADNDTLNGGTGDDILDGGIGNDILDGGNDNDQLVGGAGNDQVYGYTGDDAYYWNYGDGEDYYYDYSGTNNLVFGAGIDRFHLSFERGNVNSSTYLTGWSTSTSGQDLRITITHPTDSTLSGSIVIENWSGYRGYWNLYFEDVFYENGNRIVTPQNDVLLGTNETDTLSGLAGDDTLTGYQGDDVLYGNEGSDTLNGNDGEDVLDGGADDDTLNGGNDNDQLVGGAGNDLVYGNSGNDIYYWNYGDGEDYYNDSNEESNLVFGAGIDASQLNFERGNVTSSTYRTDWSAVASGQDLRITITHPTDASLSGSIVIENWSSYRGYWNLYFEDIFYTNGNTLVTDMDDVVTGGNGDDILRGLGGNDSLNGGYGDDQLIGGMGNDIVGGGHGFDRFIWKFGDGEDFYHANYRAGYYKTLVLGPGITSAMVTVENGNVSSSNYLTAWLNEPSGSDRKFIITHPTDSLLSGSVVIDNWKIYSGYWRVEFEDGEVWDAVAYPDPVNATGTVSDDTLNGANGADNLQGGAGDDLISAAYGADWISGDEGEDYIETGEGNDTVFWDLGDGHDFVLGAYLANERKTLKLGSEITSDMLSFEKGDISSSAFKTSKMSAWQASATGADLRVVITHPTDSSLSGSIIIDNWNSYNSYWLIELTEEMISYYGNYLITSGNDSISGTSSNDSFSGDEGDDTLYGNNGDDNLDGGVGNDTLNGGNDDDVLDGEAGDDTLNGDNGDDQLIGGTGSDLVYGSGGNDVYYWNYGDGEDYYFDYSGANNLVFGAGVDRSHLSFERGNVNSTTYLTGWTTVANGQDLKITITHPTDASFSGSIVIENWSSYQNYWNLYFEDVLYEKGNRIATVQNDMLSGTSEVDMLSGLAGDDTLTGYQGDDVLNGDEGNDTLNGNDGDDVLNGGADDDTLSGGNGYDIYYWSYGDGNDYFYDTDSLNTLVLGASITPDDLQAEKGDNVNASNYISGWSVNLDGTDLRISIHHPTDPALSGSIVIESWTSHYDHWQIEFPSGEIIPGTLLGTNGNDVLVGGAGADQVEGGLASDYCRAYEGDDSYVYHLNDGFDVWEDNQGLNTIRFGSDITPDMLTFRLYNITTTSVSEIPFLPPENVEDLGIIIKSNGVEVGFILINNWIYNTLNWRIEFTSIDPNTNQVYPAMERTGIIPELLSWDADLDGDSIPDWWELLYGLDMDTTIDNRTTDADNDGIKDSDEFDAGTSPIDADTDGDGLTDSQELLITGTNPLLHDLDKLDTDLNLDGLDDSIGIQLGISIDQLDSDGDGVSNEDETFKGTNLHNPDTDGDGENDNIDPFPLEASLDSSDFVNDPNDVSFPIIILIKPVEAIEI